jgi:Cu(I)/Ag(I) efflux system membrane fusion protein
MESFKKIFEKIWRSDLRWPVVFLVFAALIIGYFLGGGPAGGDPHAHDVAASAESSQVTVWTCSMHLQIRQPKPGQCPICGMDLIPLSSGSEEETGPRELRLSSAAMKLAEIQTAPAEKKYVVTEVRMVGKVDYDETRLSYISAWVSGRIDRLYVDFTGTSVRKGDHLVSLYSPELISAQQELLQALKTAGEVSASNNPNVRETAQRILEAVREKLRLLGLKEEQISDIEKQGEVTDHLTIYSPVSGIVIHRNAQEGMYVNTGMPIFTIADLSNVWVKLDAYESDLEWIRYGQEVDFISEAYPGETFTGKIVFIDPVLNPQTRTVKVRVNVPNPQGNLKPEMFVRAVVHSKLSVSGKVMDPSLAGKWISPMHPEIVKDHPGNCDICGMPLVPAEKLGYVPASEIQKEAPLVIPASAPLITGKRAVVYLKVPDKEGVFEGREIVLGARAGDFYIVKEGLQEGEEVVTNGNFKLDSDLQIKAKKSMMNPEGVEATTGHQHAAASEHSTTPDASAEKNEQPGAPVEFQKSLESLASAYFKIQDALSHDKLNASKQHARDFQTRLAKVDMALLQGEAHQRWMEILPKLKNSATSILNADDLPAARSAFEPLSEAVYAAIKQFGTSKQQPVYRYYCPMAFDNKGAYWLQNKQGVKNPYYGSMMFKCGEEVEVLVGK